MNSGISRRPESLEAWTSVENRRFQARGKYRDRDGPFITLRQNKHLGFVHCRGSKSFSSLGLCPQPWERGRFTMLHTAQGFQHPLRHQVRNTVHTGSAMGGVGKVRAGNVSKPVTKDHFSL